jgi:anti-sigma-K factor RskA
LTQAELHDLAAAYALNALDPEDRWTYERHLDTCERCREEVASLREGAEQLAYASEGPEPRPELRERILRAAREDAGPKVVPFRQRRWVLPLTATAAVAASIAAVGLGLWGNSLRGGTEQRVVPMTGGAGRVVVSGDSAQLITCLRQAPPGKTYEAWVIEGDTPRPAGLFRGGCTDVPLTRPVESGNTVAVTLERAGGADRPTGDVLMSANV